MEFLRSLLMRRFARAQVATSQNVGCFLRLFSSQRVLGPNPARNLRNNFMAGFAMTGPYLLDTDEPLLALW